MCYQTTSQIAFLSLDEDCLNLNVYTPVKPGSNKKLPVLLWIHGGAYQTGSSAFSYFGPKYQIDYGIVIVTINYRLSAFGFLGTEDGVIPSNVGLEDQRLAMKWVKRNIEQFGGDSNHIVIAGESAGSSSVGEHLLGSWNGEEPLFHGAIMQSGSPLARWTSPRNLTEIAVNLAQKIDPKFSPRNTTDLLKFLQKVDAQDIANNPIKDLSLDKPGPVGNLQLLMQGDYKKVPVLIGFNSEESLYFRSMYTKSFVEMYDNDSSVLIVSSMNMSPSNRTIAGKKLKEVYTNNKFADDFGAFLQYQTDVSFINSILKTVEIGCHSNPYYLYEFSYKGELGGSMDVPHYNKAGLVMHAEDLPYMWEQAGKNSDLSKFPKADQLTMQRIVKMWTNFVKHFNPTPKADPILDNVTWQPTEPSSFRYLNINATLEMKTNPRAYKQTKDILEYYMQPPFNFFD
ncbi:unnamed protein product [Phyllotreta striolata]|uniref:Carboxylic ester hydrolase n=1 Tax=Phyllotreta striolata TaxID=444603 RepID=A0A9N9TNS2_PHYSR|nr:unnamed protein product [Phyllotreta striolata]